MELAIIILIAIIIIALKAKNAGKHPYYNAKRD